MPIKQEDTEQIIKAAKEDMEKIRRMPEEEKLKWLADQLDKELIKRINEYGRSYSALMLAKACHIDNGTFNHYLNGRKLPGIINAARLTVAFRSWSYMGLVDPKEFTIEPELAIVLAGWGDLDETMARGIVRVVLGEDEGTGAQNFSRQPATV